MMRNVIWRILLCMVSLPYQLHGTPVSEETLQELLNKQIVLPTNGITTLRNLYGSQVNVHNFNPGVRMLQLLYEHPNFLIHMSLSHILDNEIAQNFDVTFDYIDKITKTFATRNLILVRGGPKTGKTRTLRIIERALFKQSEKALAVYVDLPQILNSNAVHIASIENLLRESIRSEVVDFVKNVADVNPSRVKILLDNIDKISLAHQGQIITAISELQSRRIGVIVSSTTNVAPLFTQRQMEPTVLDIPPVSEIEFETTSDNYWSHILDGEFQESHSERIRQYSKALRLMLFETPLPRSVGLLKQLLDRAASHGFQPFPSLWEFLNNPEMYPNPRAILRLSDNMHFHKATLYNQILPEPSVVVFEFEVYGIQALKMLLKPSETPAILAELGHRIDWSNIKISQHGAEAYKLMTFEKGAPVDFLHPEYKRYYAGLYISKSFATSTPLIESFKTIIHDPKHSIVAEFINSEMKPFDHTPQMEMIFSRLVTTAPNVVFQISDNLISHKLDILCSKMLRALGQANYLTGYINNPTITLKSKNKYSFGMLAEVENANKDYYIPRRTRWMYSGTRIEMILNLKLTRSCYTLMQYGHTVDPNLLLISAAREPYGLLKLLNGNGRRNYPVEVLNRAMYESLKALGPDSIDNMRTLKAHGARPAAINVEGRTLAHEAARWHSQELLEVIHEEFLVSLYDTRDRSGYTILFELLDHALPSNEYIEYEAWGSISYLAEHGDLYVNEEIIKNSIDSFISYTPSLDIVNPSLQSVIAYDDNSPASRGDAIDTLKRFIPIEDADIPREILSMRRLLITKNCLKTMLAQSATRIISSLKTPDFVTVAELVLSHKPIENAFQFDHYQNAMKYLLTKKSLSFNPPQMERVCNIIVKNMYMAADFVRITQMIRNNVVKVEPEIIPNLKQSYELRIQHGLSHLSNNRNFETRAVETMYDLHLNIEFNNAMVEIALIEENLNYVADGQNLIFSEFECVI